MKKLLMILVSLATFSAFAAPESVSDYVPAAEIAEENPEIANEVPSNAQNGATEDWAGQAAEQGGEKVPDYDSDYNFKYATEDGANEVRKEKKPWYRGWQIGVGVPVLPLGYNGFIGYANKKAESFWGKRFGARLDFQIPSELRVTSVLNDNGGGYDVNATVKMLFMNLKFNELTNINYVEMDTNDDGIDEIIDVNGVNAKLALKNRNIGGLVDFYPFGSTWFLGGLRLSGGYYTGRLDFGVVGNLPNDFPGNGMQYGFAGDKIIGKVNGGSKIAANFKWKYSGPYLGAGFDLGILAGFKFYADVGVVFAKPPKVSRGDMNLPIVTACYVAGGGNVCGNDATIFDLNSKPDVTYWMKSILSQVIKQKVVSGAVGAIDDNVKDKIAEAIFGLGHDRNDLNANTDFGRIADDVLGYVDGTGATPQWLTTLIADNTGADSQEIEDMLTHARDNWTGGDKIYSEMQDSIDDMWNDYEKGINDINNSMKDMRFMPVVKIGVMYRF
jgi:hypothetical protein